MQRGRFDRKVGAGPWWGLVLIPLLVAACEPAPHRAEPVEVDPPMREFGISEPPTGVLSEQYTEYARPLGAEHPPHHAEQYRMPAEELDLPGKELGVAGLRQDLVPPGASAAAVLEPTDDGEPSMQGRATFEQTPEGLVLRVEVHGLPPDGVHGIHVHEIGDCTGDASGAGGHFDPYDRPHGAPGHPPHHAGDLGNLHADPNGRALLEMPVPWLALAGTTDVRGRALIVHERRDDLQTQPTGDAGDRILCGVIMGGLS